VALSDPVRLEVRVFNTVTANAYFIHYHCVRSLVKRPYLFDPGLCSELLALCRMISVVLLALSSQKSWVSISVTWATIRKKCWDWFIGNKGRDFGQRERLLSQLRTGKSKWWAKVIMTPRQYSTGADQCRFLHLLTKKTQLNFGTTVSVMLC